MTVIAAMKKPNGEVVMASDRQATSRYTRSKREDGKIFFVKDDRDNEVFLIGGAGSYRFIQTLRFGFTPAYRTPDRDVFEYMVTEFAEAARKRAKDAGILQQKENVETNGSSGALVACAGRIFHLESDFQIAEVADDYAAEGSGTETALGAMFALTRLELSEAKPDAIVTTAVQAASHHTPYCGFGVDIHILKNPNDTTDPAQPDDWDTTVLAPGHIKKGS